MKHTCIPPREAPVPLQAEQSRQGVIKPFGYDGIIVTDHFFNGNCAVTNFDSWEDRVNKFCKGYENAKEVGDEIGLKVFFGLEYSYFGADLLTYGIDKDFLLANDNISDISFLSVCRQSA